MSQANKRTIRMVREEAMRNGRLDKLDGLYADDYVYHGIPMLGDLRGPTAFKDLARGFIDAVSGFQEKVEDQIAEGDKVVTRLSGRGKHTGELMDAAVVVVLALGMMVQTPEAEACRHARAITQDGDAPAGTRSGSGALPARREGWW